MTTFEKLDIQFDDVGRFYCQLVTRTKNGSKTTMLTFKNGHDAVVWVRSTFAALSAFKDDEDDE